ncbi:MAG: hypothetical protein JXQ84_03085, partial [Rhodospirillaceae bacterium]|nr:hypothetical protein [Rhodospirillaceae bacterium]
FHDGINHTLSKVLRIGFRHPMLASSPSQHVESDFPSEGNPISDSTYSQNALGSGDYTMLGTQKEQAKNKKV